MSLGLSLVYKEDLWFQIGELIEDLIILVKDCFFLHNTQNDNIWNLFGKNLFFFHGKFTNTEKELLPQSSFLVLTIGVVRFHALYNEEKLVFIENEIHKNKSIFKNNKVIILLFQEIIFIYSTLSIKDRILHARLHKVLSTKIITSDKIKKFMLIITEKKLNLGKNIFTEKKKKKKNINKINLFERFFVSKYDSKYGVHFLKYFDVSTRQFFFKKIKTLCQMLKQSLVFRDEKPDFLDLEKREWYDSYIFKNSTYGKPDSIRANTFEDHEHIFKQKSVRFHLFYQKFFFEFFTFSYKQNLRWSKVSKKINGKNFFFEKLSVSILTQFSGKLVLNQERQLISIIQKKGLENFLTKKMPERYIFSVQEILNKLFIMKQKLLGRTFYRDKNTSEFKQQLTDTIEIKNNFRNYTHQIENTFKNEKFKGKKFYLL
jgi:hypothetical protein